MTEASEFQQIYKLGVVPIPTNRPMVRHDEADLVYRTESAKLDAVIEDVAERHDLGQPVLVGTASVEKSEIVSTLLRRRGVVRADVDGRLQFDEGLARIAEDAQMVLSEALRHSILQVTHA